MRVLVSNGTGRAVRDGGLSRWLAAVAPPRAAGEVSVALVSDARMRALNRQYRRKDSPTDVLSFRTEVLPTDSVRISQRSRGPTPKRCRSRFTLTAAQGCRSPADRRRSGRAAR